MWPPNPQFPEDLVTFTKEMLNGKFIFCAVFLAWMVLANVEVSNKEILYLNHLGLLITLSWQES